MLRTTFPASLPGDRWSPAQQVAAGLVAAVALHVGAGAALWSAAHETRLMKPTPRERRVVELSLASPPEPPPLPVAEVAPPPPPEPTRPAERPTGSPMPPTSPPEEAAAPATAGAAIVTDAPSEPGPDMLDFTLATGDAPRYVGRATAAESTAMVGRDIGQVSRHGRGRGGAAVAGPDLSRSARLPARSWDCDWPTQADALGIDAQRVVLRVDLDARGRARHVTLVDDPGYGFGSAAVRCARDARYEPARDRDGKPMASRLGPIRVHFER